MVKRRPRATQWPIADGLRHIPENWVGLGFGEFNVGLELRKWAIADGLGLMPEDDPETCRHNFDQSRRGWLPRC